jgi:hypothetical protein
VTAAPVAAFVGATPVAAAVDAHMAYAAMPVVAIPWLRLLFSVASAPSVMLIM